MTSKWATNSNGFEAIDANEAESRQMSKGRFEKTLRIGVRFNGAGFVLLDGQPLPKLVKDSVAELMLLPENIADESARTAFSAEKDVSFLAAGAIIMLGVSPRMMGKVNREALIDARALRVASEYQFIEAKLDGDLFLRVRGDQEASLLSCDCNIPALNAPALSLNHAFTLISQVYETLRRSHSGNVFERAYALDKAERWRSLDDLRTAAIGGLLRLTSFAD